MNECCCGQDLRVICLQNLVLNWDIQVQQLSVSSPACQTEINISIQKEHNGFPSPHLE